MVKGLCAIALAFLIYMAPTAAFAHPLHTSFATLTVDERTGIVEVSLRVFVDDFTSAANEWARKQSRTNASPTIGYALASFILRDTQRMAVRLQSCGQKQVGDLMWVCLRGRLSPKSAVSAVASRILTEKYADQVNIVQASYARRRSNLLFTAGDGEKRLH